MRELESTRVTSCGGVECYCDFSLIWPIMVEDASSGSSPITKFNLLETDFR